VFNVTQYIHDEDLLRLILKTLTYIFQKSHPDILISHLGWHLQWSLSWC